MKILLFLTNFVHRKCAVRINLIIKIARFLLTRFLSKLKIVQSYRGLRIGEARNSILSFVYNTPNTPDRKAIPAYHSVLRYADNRYTIVLNSLQQSKVGIALGFVIGALSPWYRNAARIRFERALFRRPKFERRSPRDFSQWYCL